MNIQYVEYHSMVWAYLVTQGWITMYVENIEIAGVMQRIAVMLWEA